MNAFGGNRSQNTTFTTFATGRYVTYQRWQLFWLVDLAATFNGLIWLMRLNSSFGC